MSERIEKLREKLDFDTWIWDTKDIKESLYRPEYETGFYGAIEMFEKLVAKGFIKVEFPDPQPGPNVVDRQQDTA